MMRPCTGAAQHALLNRKLYYDVEFMDRGTARHLDIRIMATTDLHMNLLGYDYFLGRESHLHGLSAVASLIGEFRTTHENCLLFDNGDLLQGTPLGDYIAETWEAVPRSPHPAIEAMNRLGYDAATLGNHDFAFGGDFLLSAIASATFPVTVANLHMKQSGSISRSAILEREFSDRAGRRQTIRIGVLGFLPPQTTDWDSALRPMMQIADIVQTAQREAPALKAAGADIVIALAHSGIAGTESVTRMENAAVPLAAVEGIDAIIAGHIHRVFPAPDFPASPCVDPVSGRLHGKPTMMPGFWGSHLGVMDLTLVQEDARWTVSDAAVRVVPARQQPDRGISAIVQRDHEETIRHFARPIARTDAPLNSFLTFLGYDAGLRLVNQAQAAHVRRALAGTDAGKLPVLSTTAPGRAGGRGGPDHYTDIDVGQLSLRNLADLYVYPNRICALEICGADLRDWLERSAGIYRRITPGLSGQRLIDPDFPGYNFDVLEGLTWRIDLTRPARYDPSGRLVAPDAHRIRDLCHEGAPVADDDRFILATNSYRLSGCGLFAPLATPGKIVLDDAVRTRDILRHHVAEPEFLAPPDELGFSFCPIAGADVIFETSPAATRFLSRIGSLAPETIGLSEQGFMQLRLHP